jgi:hypothetical protein
MLTEDAVLEWRRGQTWKAVDVIEMACQRAGMPAMSPWWRETLERFYRTRKRELVLRVGRRGGKSSTLCRVAVLEGLFGRHEVPPGDVGVIAFVSVLVDDAKERLRTIRTILDAIEEPYRAAGNVILLERWNRAFKVYAATVAATSGFTCVTAIADEVAKWRDADTGANPAREILSSLRPTLAGHEHAKLFLSSSPLGRLDAHAKAFESGKTPVQEVAWAPTWVARPDLTEDLTRTYEERNTVWMREYGAVPMEGTEESLYTPGLLTRATRPVGDVEPQSGHHYVAAMDPGMRANAWTFVVATKRKVGKDYKRSVVFARQWQGTRECPNDSTAVMTEIAGYMRTYKCPCVYTDQFAADALRSIGLRVGANVAIQNLTQVGKLELYESLGTRFNVGEIEIPPDPVVRNDLLSVRRKVTPNGFVIVLARTPDDRHADYAPAIALAVSHATLEPEPPAPERDEMETMALRRQEWETMKERGFDEEYDPGRGYGEVGGEWLDV